MKLYLRHIISLLILISGFSARGQSLSLYNLNIYNGLPSNHVYCAVKDQYGYLWLATNKGLVRYNGYEYKIYNTGNGLADDDVWGIYKDRKNRLWLYGLSNKVGYVYNSRYKQVYLKDVDQMIYPKRFTDYNTTVIFETQSYNKKNGNNLIVCFEQNDTVYVAGRVNSLLFVNKNSEINCVDGSMFSKFTFNGKTVSLAKQCIYPANNPLKNMIQGECWFNNYLVKFGVYTDTLIIHDCAHCTNKVMNISSLTGRKEKITYICDLRNYYNISNKDNKLMAITNYGVYFFDTSFRMLDSFSIKQLTGTDISGFDLTHVLNDSLWGKCVATSKHGIFINYWQENQFYKVGNFDLAEYKFLGTVNDSINFWWNSSTHTMAKTIADKQIVYKYYSVISDARKVLPYDAKRSLLLVGNNIYFLNNGDLSLSEYFDLSDADIANKVRSLFRFPLDAYSDGQGALYTTFSSNGFNRFDISKNVLNISQINEGIYRHLSYDSFRKGIWVYSSSDVLFYKDGAIKSIFSDNIFSKLKAGEIEQIVTDKYGDIFFKCAKRLFVFNFYKNVYKQLYENIRLNDANMFIRNDMLIIAGRFGVLFSRISGSGKYTAPIVYRNIKNESYYYIYYSCLAGNKVLLSTDKGVYSTPIPPDSIFNTSKGTPAQAFQFVLDYGDNMRNITSGDTVAIDQDNKKLQFDVINPAGNGLPKYDVLLGQSDSAWHLLNANELNLPDLTPDRYYDLSIIAYDNVWQSNRIHLYLYVVPYWWQTSVGKKVVWVIGIFLFGAFLFLVIIITQRIVARNAAKKNQMLELEVKSIYSQINPHFIFNTLNAALHFIAAKKLDEAYIHISRFSRLLRAYLKSSRNKYVAISEEVANLKNYIELQQTRFANAFSYEIIIDDRLNATKASIPSLLLQPIVENAINHGLLPKEGKGHLLIEFARGISDNEIICIVDDDGIGRKRSKQTQENDTVRKESYGSELIKELVNVFNKYENIKIEIVYLDKEEPLSGTTVKLIIKNPHYNE